MKFLRALDPIVWTAAGLIVLATACNALSLWAIRYASLGDAQANNRTMAAVLADQASQSIQAIDLLLGDLAARVAAAGVADQGALHSMLGGRAGNEFLKERLASLRQADFLTVVDATGAFVGSSRPEPVQPFNLSGRDVFERQKEAGPASLIASRSPSSRFNGEWMVYFSRRIEAPDGAFLGVAVAGVRPQFFLRLFEGLSRTPGAFARLVRDDGLVLANYPNVSPQRWDRVPANAPWQEAVKAGGGAYRFVSEDGTARLVAVHPLAGFPVVINAGVAEEAVLDLWRQRAVWRILIGALVSVFVIALVCSLLYMYRRAGEARARVRAQSEELSKFNLRLEAVLSNMKQGVAMFDASDRLVVCNARYTTMYGLTPAQAPPGTPLADILKARIANNCFAGDADQYMRAHLSHFEHNTRLDHSALDHLRDGRYLLISHLKLPGGGWIATHEDVTERQTAAERIAHVARHDGLTDLENRSAFFSRIEELSQRGAAGSHAMIVVDLDAFKAVNDKHGHLVGDALIKAVAERLRSAVGPADVVARLGGDEFAILQALPGGDLGPAIDLARKLLDGISRPYRLDDREVKVGLSIGVAALPDGDAGAALRNADLALYRAKGEGRNCYRVFEAGMADEVDLRHRLAADLEQALAGDGLSLLYQPVVEARTLRITAMETTAQWSHPVRGMIAADDLFELAEESGLIGRLGAFILNRACRDAATWPSDIKICVNVTPAQAARANLADVVARALAASGLPHDRLEIEITEPVLLESEDHNLDMLRALHAAGVAITLDEFGAGVTSLGSLNRFPLDKIKIDRKLVSRLDIDPESTSIVAAMASIARAFQAEIAADGVETEAQRRLLQAAGILEMQGDHFGAPRPAEDWRFERDASLMEVLAPAA